MPVAARTMPSTPKPNTSRPLATRTARRPIHTRSGAPSIPIVSSIGKVPRPNASMTAAPPAAEPASMAVSNTL